MSETLYLQTRSQGRVSSAESKFMPSSPYFITDHEPVTRSELVSHLVLRSRLG